MSETLSSFIARVCGTYNPIVDASGVIPAGMAGVDWVYIANFVLLVVVIYSVLRIIGGLICRY